ncbi:allulose-6-phosphate 3-epimerase [Staphylococcus shinii]|uniref:allulose-6-phosphate 3-epimerase n=1 Tax=Staphylococcus shinii TaxID=2912228 RepID=UPI003F56E3EF
MSPWFIEQVKRISSVPISTHLMVTNPTQWIDQLIKIGSDYICVHAEVMNGIAYRLINQVHNANLKFGVVLNPETKIDVITPYIDLVDKITIMTVDPGFAGEKFIDNTLEKIRELRVLRDINNFGYLIEMDGSSNKNTFEKIQKAGPDIYILGRSGLFGLNESIEESWHEMLEDFNKAKSQIL